MYDAVKTRENLIKGLDEMKTIIPEVIDAQQAAMSIVESAQVFKKTDEAIESEGALDARTKLLMCFSVMAYLRCEECLSLHLQKAVDLGLTRQEIIEAAGIAIAFHGGPAMGWTATHILPGLDQFGIK